MEIKKNYGFGPQATDSLELRLDVFTKEQGFSIADEIDDLDEDSTHYVGYIEGDTPVTTARIHKDKPGSWHIQRVATAKDYRGKGYSTELLNQVEADAREKHMKSLELGAQLPAQGFYEKLGYVAEGDEFLDAGAPHIHMVKDLSHK